MPLKGQSSTTAVRCDAPRQTARARLLRVYSTAGGAGGHRAHVLSTRVMSRRMSSDWSDLRLMLPSGPTAVTTANTSNSLCAAPPTRAQLRPYNITGANTLACCSVILIDMPRVEQPIHAGFKAQHRVTPCC